MAISTNSIIHYTSSLENLISILKEGFRVKYCNEKIILTSNNRSSSAAHPMVCFCDIPITQSYDHLKNYGFYGIGLTKIWASANGISPVLYIEKGSYISKTIYELLSERKTNHNLPLSHSHNILRVKAFSKNYKGDFTRIIDGKEVTYSNYIFYNEREWRYIPSSEELNKVRFSIPSNEYLENKDKFNSKLSDLKLNFTIDDIAYIIVRENSEVSLVIEEMRHMLYNKYTPKQIDILYSKIFTIEQIRNDF